MKQPPGLLISAPSSGTGKTTVMLGLLRALRDKGLVVQPFKSGPDYIDPAFHFAAAGRNSYNLDSWAMSDVLMDNLVALSDGADLILTEGSMGLYDGVAKPGQFGHGSSAETALAFGWPVILIVDVSGQAQSSAATALGFSNYNKEINIAGVILNRVASPRHERLARLGFEKAGLKVLGALPRRGDLVLPERHLGLIQAVEHPNLEKAIADYGIFLASNVDLDGLQQLAQSGVKAPNSNSQLNLPNPPGQRIALAHDEVFSFTYPHILRHWHSSGAELSFFSPVLDEIPDKSADIIWMPGGYPELHAGKLATAENCFSAIRDHAQTRSVHGECGGYMVLGSHLIDKEGTSHKMIGLLGLVTSYAKRKFNLGYRLAETNSPVEIFSANKKLRGHEFHYSSIIEQPDEPLFSVKDAEGNAVSETGSVCGKVSGTFFHMIAEAD